MGMDKETVDLTAAALEEQLSDTQREIALGSLAISQSSTEGDLRSVDGKLKELAALQEASGKTRFAGISGRTGLARSYGSATPRKPSAKPRRAEALHGGLVNPSYERVGATSVRTVAMAQLGRLDEARQLVQSARAEGSRLAQMELASERAEFEVEFGSAVEAEQALRILDAPEAVSGHRGILNLLGGQIALRRGDFDLALEMVRRLGTDACVDAAGKFRGQVVLARACIALQRPDRTTQAVEALRLATAQGSAPATRLAELLVGIAEDRPIDDLIMQTIKGETFIWSLIAEDIAKFLVSLSPAALVRIQDEAARRPERWQSALRLAVDEGRAFRTFCGRDPRRDRVARRCGSSSRDRRLEENAAAARIADGPAFAQTGVGQGPGAVEVSLGTE